MSAQFGVDWRPPAHGLCLARLVRNSKPGKNVQLAENEIRGLCLKSRELFLSQPILLELEAPLKICGKPRRRPPARPPALTSACP